MRYSLNRCMSHAAADMTPHAISSRSLQQSDVRASFGYNTLFTRGDLLNRAVGKVVPKC